MNKFEMELNENKAKAFFVRHGEKVGLGVAAGLLGTFAYLGMGLSPDLQGRTPSSLEATVTSAENHIKNGRWETLRPQRLAISGTVDKLDSSKQQVAASDFTFDYLLARRSAAAALRSDPKLAPITSPEVNVDRVSLADTASGRHPLGLLTPLALEEAAATGGRQGGPAMDDGSGRRTKTGPTADLGAVVAAPGIDPVKAGLPDLQNPAPVDRYVATVKYLFPFKENYLSFRNTFRNAVGYNASNDRFLVRHLEIQRRVNGGEWEDYTNQIKEQEKTYVVSAPDPFDDKYANRALTRAFPPVLLNNYYAAATHRQLPAFELPEDPTLAATTPTGRDGGDRDRGAQSGRSGMSGQSGMSGRSGMSGMSGRSGMSGQSGMSGRSGMAGAMSGMSGRSGMSGMSGRSGMSGMSGRSGQSGQSGTASMAVEEPLDLVDYKLIRFSDPTVVPGNEYEYRVRYWVYDPNNPIKMAGFVDTAPQRQAMAMSATASDGERESEVQDEDELENEVIQSRVKLDHLSPEVRERLTLESSLQRPLPVLTNCRPSAWSEPTPSIRVSEIRGDALVGTASIPSPVKSTVGNQEVKFSVREGSVRMLAAIWDSTFGIKIPLVNDAVYPGSLLGGTAVTKVLDPITREYRKLENNDGMPVAARTTAPGYTGNSGMVLVDFLGGREILGGSESKTKFMVPTEALVVDATGQLQVRSADANARDFTWLSGEVLREDGLIDKLAEAAEDQGGAGDEREGRGRAAGGRSGRSGFPGGGGPPGNNGPPGGDAGRSGRSGMGGGAGRSGRPGGNN